MSIPWESFTQAAVPVFTGLGVLVGNKLKQRRNSKRYDQDAADTRFTKLRRDLSDMRDQALKVDDWAYQVEQICARANLTIPPRPQPPAAVIAQKAADAVADAVSPPPISPGA